MTLRTSRRPAGVSAEAQRLQGPIRIVVADGQTLYREALRMVIDSEPGLRWAGETGDGREVLPLVGAVKPHVILLQLQMPKVNGLALFQELQSFFDTIKIILLVDVDELEKLGTARELGASEQVGRGSTPQALISAIRRVASGMEESEEQRPVAGLETPLSRREREIGLLVAQGRKNKEIADQLFIGAPTVKNHLRNIFRKLGISDRRELAVYAQDTLANPSETEKSAKRRRASL